jgi:hypothetical protein
MVQFIMTADDPRMRITLPDANDSTKGDTLEENSDFSKGLEINRYCLNRRNDILNLIEKLYPSMEPRIRRRYGI